MVVTERYASLTDADLYASIWREGSIGGNVFLVRSEVLADIGSSYDSVEPSAVHVNGSDRFAIAFTRRNASFSRVRVFLSPEGSTSLGQGQWMILNEFVPGSRDSHPALSGSRDAGLTALLAVQSDLPNGGPHTIRGLWLNSATATINRAPFAIAEPAGPFRADYEAPATLPVRDDGEDQFVVVYRSPDRVSTQAGIVIRRQRFDGTLTPAVTLVSGGPARETRYDLRIAGGDGEYVVGWQDYLLTPPPFEVLNPFGFTIARFRLSSSDTTAVGLSSTSYTGADIDPGTPALVPRIADLAFDHETRSHWMLGFRVSGFIINTTARLWRLGGDGFPADRATLQTTSNNWNTREGPFVRQGVGRDFRSAFEIVDYAPDPDREELWFQDYEPPVGQFVSGVSGCNGGGVLSGNAPTSGNRLFRVDLRGGAPNRPATLLFAFAGGRVSLDPIGAPGCVVGLDPAVILGEPAPPTDGSGATTYPLPLPSAVRGDLHAQWLLLDPTAPGDLRLSNSARIEIR